MAVATDRDHDATRAALADWLQRQTGHPAEVGDLSIPGLSGFSNETILFDARWDGVDHGLVVRVEPTGHQIFPSTAFEVQVRVMRAIAESGAAPVPVVRWFEEDVAVLGDRFIVMDRVAGEVPADNPSYHVEGWLADLPEAAQAAVWCNGVDAMAAIHRLDLDRSGLNWVPVVTPSAHLEQTHAYRRFACGDHPMPAMDDALDALAGSLPDEPRQPRLCWGDSRLGNLMFGEDQSVVAVLDWEMVTAGDPVQDLAWYLLIDRHHHEAFGVPRLPGLPARDETVAQWEEASGCSAAALDWYELLGAVRYAAVMTRVMDVLETSGLFPGAAEMMYDHTGTALLQRLLDERG